MADESTDVIIPLSADTSKIDESLDALQAKVESLTSKLAALESGTEEYKSTLKDLTSTTETLAAANQKFDNTLTTISKSSKKFSDDTKTMSDNITSAADGATSLSDSLNKTFTDLQQSGESAKEAAQGTEWYKETLEALRSEGGLTNVTLNELKATQKDLEKAMADAQPNSEEWKRYRDDLNEVKQAQTEYKNLARDTDGEMKAHINTIAGMRANVSALSKEWAHTDMGSPQFEELSKQLADATEKLKEHEFAVGKNQRDVGNYAGQIEKLLPQLSGMVGGMKLLGPATGIATGGINSLNQAVKAFMANSLGVFLTVAVGALKLFSTITAGSAAKASEKFTKKVEQETAELKTNSDTLYHNIDLLRARGATSVEVANAELDTATKLANDARDLYEKHLSAYEGRSLIQRLFFIGKGADKAKREALEQLKKDADEASKIVNDAADKAEITLTAEQTKADKERADKAKKAAEDRIAAQKKAAEELKTVEEGITSDLSDEFTKRRIAEEKEYQERLAILQKNGQSTAELERLHQQNLTQIQKDEEAKRSADAAAAYNAQIAKQDAAYKAEEEYEAARAAARDASRVKAQADLMQAEATNDEALREAATARLEEYRLLDEEAEALQREKEAGLLQNRLTLLYEQLENEHIIGNERIALEQSVSDTRNAIILNAATSAKAIADKQLNDYKAQIAAQKKLDDEAAKNKQKTQGTVNAAIQTGINVATEGTVASKALNTAQAIMNTWAGATQALNNPFPYNLAAMAATITAGLASVVKIWKVEVPGASSSGSMPDVSNIPNLQPVATYQTPITETHSNITGDEIDEINKSTKVYVTESDISDTQNRVHVNESEAVF